MAEKIAVIGSGGWGTALAKVLAELGHDVRLWCREPELAESIRAAHENTLFLPGVILPQRLSATTDALEAVEDRDVIILATPSAYLIPTLRKILPSPRIMDGEVLIITVTKGFIPGPKGPRLILEALEDYLPGFYRGKLVYLSGPSHAEEVGRSTITGLVAASQNGRNGIRTRELFKGSRVLVFPSLDVIGVQAAAAAKNVIAIAFGMLDALAGGETAGSGGAAFGDNTESLLLAAGLNEIRILGSALGASHAETFSSIAGVGDLDVTCRSRHGRNRRFGRDIVQKGILNPFADIRDLLSRISEIGYLPEGALAAKEVREIAARERVSLPIMDGVYSILDRKAEPREFLESYLAAMGASLDALGEL